MDWGSPEFVLWIIGLVMAASVFKTAIRAKNGMSDFPGHGGKRARLAEIAALRDQSSGQLDNLNSENRRLRGRVEAMEDRLIVLEKIVTDGSYTLATEIESLRDRAPTRREIEETKS
jgi:hypothetical protein